MPDLVLREVSKETTLEKLRFLCMPQLTDATICSVFAGCTNLKLLELFDTELITAETVRAYLRNGRKCRLQIRDCPGASRENLPEELRGVQQEVFP